MLFHALFFYVTALTFYHSYREVSISWFTNYHLQGSSLDLSTVFEKKKKKRTWVLILVMEDKYLSLSLNLVTNNKDENYIVIWNFL